MASSSSSPSSATTARGGPAIKRSDSPVKVLNPGRKRLWRVYDERGRATADVLSTDTEVITAGEQLHLHHHSRPDLPRTVVVGGVDQLLVPVVDRGSDRRPTTLHDLDAAGDRRVADVDALDPGVRRLVNPHTYHVSITDELFDLRLRLLSELGAVIP